MLNFNAIATWIESNVFFVLVVIAAAVIATAAITKKARDAALVFGIMMLAFLMIVVSHNLDGIIKWMGGFFG